MAEQKYQLTVRMNEDEKKWLTHEAKRRGLPLANFIVSCCNFVRRDQANEKIDMSVVLLEINNSLKVLNSETEKITQLDGIFYGILGGVSAIRTENLMAQRNSAEPNYWEDYKKIASDSARSFVKTGVALKAMLKSDRHE